VRESLNVFARKTYYAVVNTIIIVRVASPASRKLRNYDGRGFPWRSTRRRTFGSPAAVYVPLIEPPDVSAPEIFGTLFRRRDSFSFSSWPRKKRVGR